MSKNALIILSVIDRKMTVAEVAKEYKVSRTWVYELLRRYSLLGPLAFQARSKAHHRDPNSLSDELHQEIAKLRQDLVSQGLDAGAQSIHFHLKQKLGHAPSLSSIWRSLRRQGLVEYSPQKKPKLYLQRFEAALPNETWQSDFTHVRLVNGADILVLNFLDDHSRFLLSCTAHRKITSPTVVQAFLAAGDQHGFPQSSLTDNGLVFTSRMQRGMNSYELLLQRMGIEQKNSRPNHPQTQGKIERFHQTLKKWLLVRAKPKTLQELQALLDEFSDVYNNHRPHRSLHGKTPAQAYQARPKAQPRNDPIFGHHRTLKSKVDNAGKVSLRMGARMRHVGVGREHTSKPVLLIMDSRKVIVTDLRTGEILGENQIEPTRAYWPKIKNPGRSLDS
jgi:transposase InsO family protein